MKRSTTPEEMLEAAKACTGYCAFHVDSENGIYEAAKVKSVGDDEITFDMSALGMADKTVPVSDLRYFEG